MDHGAAVALHGHGSRKRLVADGAADSLLSDPPSRGARAVRGLLLSRVARLVLGDVTVRFRPGLDLALRGVCGLGPAACVAWPPFAFHSRVGITGSASG